MPAKKVKTVSNEEVTPEVTPENVEVTPEVEAVATPTDVVATGKFQAVIVEGGAVVYNGFGVAVSEVIPEAEAKDIVLKSNSYKN